MARLYLSPGETYGFIGSFDVTQVIGTNSDETVYVGPNGKATFDPSFNRGGDEIAFLTSALDVNTFASASGYDGVRSGSNLLITNDAGASLAIPIGSGGTIITFAEGSFDLGISDGVIKLGDQVITTTAASLDNLGDPVSAPAAYQPPESFQAFAAAPVPDLVLDSSMMSFG